MLKWRSLEVEIECALVGTLVLCLCVWYHSRSYHSVQVYFKYKWVLLNSQSAKINESLERGIRLLRIVDCSF